MKSNVAYSNSSDYDRNTKPQLLTSSNGDFGVRLFQAQALWKQISGFFAVRRGKKVARADSLYNALRLRVDTSGCGRIHYLV